MNLLPRIEYCSSAGAGEKAKVAAAAATAQMTIFYSGRVMVYDNFPADKAKELFDKVGRGNPAAGSSVAPHDAVAPAAAAATQPQKPDILPDSGEHSTRSAKSELLDFSLREILARSPEMLISWATVSIRVSRFLPHKS